MGIREEQLDEFVHFLQALTETGFVRWRIEKGVLGDEIIAEFCASIQENPDEDDEPVTLSVFNCNYGDIVRSDNDNEGKEPEPLDHEIYGEEVGRLLATVKKTMKKHPFPN
jgi:hypothetical protein